MTVKDLQKQMATHSTNELYLMELALYRELEKRGELLQPTLSDTMLDDMVRINNNMKQGTSKTYNVKEFGDEMYNVTGARLQPRD